MYGLFQPNLDLVGMWFGGDQIKEKNLIKHTCLKQNWTMSSNPNNYPTFNYNEHNQKDLFVHLKNQ